MHDCIHINQLDLATAKEEVKNGALLLFIITLCLPSSLQENFKEVWSTLEIQGGEAGVDLQCLSELGQIPLLDALAAQIQRIEEHVVAAERVAHVNDGLGCHCDFSSSGIDGLLERAKKQ